LFQRSQEFDNGYWEKYRCDLTTNTQISPDGTQNAETFKSSVGQSAVPAIATTNITFIGNTRYSASIFVKKIGTTEDFVLGYVDNSSGYTGGKASYNVSTQVITITQSPNSSVTASMEDYGNGWYRLVLNFLTIATPTYNYVEIHIPSINTSNTFAIWGAQLEAGSYATSYIPTTSASVTRNADVFSVSLPNTDMTFCAYLELAEPTLGSNTGDWLQIYNNVSILGRGYGYAQAVGFADAYVLGATASSSRKIIWKQESGTTAKIFLDGVLVATSTTGTYSNPFNRLGIFGEHLSKPAKINMFTFFNENLTDAQCIELTTL
jgi:hypothetical protein